MSVEMEVGLLTTAVDNLTSAVNVQKATLDGSVATATVQAAASAINEAATLGYRDETITHKDQAYAHSQSAASAVVYQDLTAIAETKVATAVDVFVYDTSLDSDGGAWRKRCQHLSWYNEPLNTATRGSTKAFPAVAVIVLETNKLTVYNGDDPALPMWMVFTSSVGSHIHSNDALSIIARDGLMAIGKDIQGLRVISFLADEARAWKMAGSSYSGKASFPISGRNAISLWDMSGSGIVNATVNDVAFTVLKSAPTNPGTGLPRPTIAVATNGGISVIKDDGNIWDITGQSWPVIGVSFNENKELITTSISGDDYAVYDIPSSDIGHTARKRYYSPLNAVTVNPGKDSPVFTCLLPCFVGLPSGVSLLAENDLAQNEGMVAYIAANYNSGWLQGDTKGAYMASTETPSLIASGELVVNGDFGLTTDWTYSGPGAGEIVAGQLHLTRATEDQSAAQTISGLVVGKRYRLELDVASITAGGKCRVSVGSVSTILNTADLGLRYAYFTAAAITADLVIWATGIGTEDVYVNSFSIKLADEDRSAKANGLVITGTLTRTPVAAGAKLVGYGGFSATNYLEQPFSSELDFGTGDFCVIGWCKGPATTGRVIIRESTVNDKRRFALDCTGGVYRGFTTGSVGSSIITSAISSNTAEWKFLLMRRLAGQLELYVNGVLAGSTASADDVTSPDLAVLRFGTGVFTTSSFAGSLALWRLSATVPSPAQIAKIYNDEKHLFKENAQCTLYGGSDAVTAVAHDPVTNLLHVGTSAGRSVFNGLQRVSRTTTPVITAISAVNGMIGEQ